MARQCLDDQPSSEALGLRVSSSDDESESGERATSRFSPNERTLSFWSALPKKRAFVSETERKTLRAASLTIRDGYP